MTLDRPLDRLALSYAFGLELFSKTVDPASGERLLGYTNDLDLAYRHQFGSQTQR